MGEYPPPQTLKSQPALWPPWCVSIALLVACLCNGPHCGCLWLVYLQGKYLICGDVNGDVASLDARVTALNASAHGPFSAVFVVGGILPAGGAADVEASSLGACLRATCPVCDWQGAAWVYVCVRVRACVVGGGILWWPVMPFPSCRQLPAPGSRTLRSVPQWAVCVCMHASREM
jgi:hypothetical protein